MLEIEVEIGQLSPTANSWIDIEYVDAWSKRIPGFSRWSGGYSEEYQTVLEADFELSDEAKIHYIVGAGYLLNQLDYSGNKVDQCQYMQFPRNFNNSCGRYKSSYGSMGSRYGGGYSSYGLRNSLSKCSGIVPEDIKQAQLILVRDMLGGYIDPTGKSYIAPVQSFFFQSTGSTVFSSPVFLASSPTQGQVTVHSDPLHSIRRLIKPFVKNIRSGVSVLQA